MIQDRYYLVYTGAAGSLEVADFGSEKYCRERLAEQLLNPRRRRYQFFIVTRQEFLNREKKTVSPESIRRRAGRPRGACEHTHNCRNVCTDGCALETLEENIARQANIERAGKTGDSLICSAELSAMLARKRYLEKICELLNDDEDDDIDEAVAEEAVL